MRYNLDWGNLVGAAGAGAGSLLVFLFGGWDTLLMVLVCMSVIDFISGILAATYEGHLNSQVGYKGIIRKVGIYLIVALACLIEKATGTELLRSAVIGFYIAMEGISIIENGGRCGLPYPQILRDKLEQLKGKEEKASQ